MSPRAPGPAAEGSQPFAGQVAVIIGATGGIGRAVSEGLYDRGATVCLVARTSESLNELARQMRGPSDGVRCYAVDLSQDEAIEQFTAEFTARFREIHVLVHAAGAITLESVSAGSMADFDNQLQVNVRAPYLITQALLPPIVRCRGQIVFVNSSAGLHGKHGAAQYSATKHALRALADSLREEVNASGVRVLSVFLGRTASRMQEALHHREQRLYDPAKLLQPGDVASVIVNALELPRTAEVTDVSIRPLLKSY